MPATAIHQSVTKILVKKLNINDELFFVGNIAPDCWRHSPLHKNKYASHFTTHICLNNQLAKIEDYKAFALKIAPIKTCKGQRTSCCFALCHIQLET